MLPRGVVNVENSVEYAVCDFRAGYLCYPEEGESIFPRNVDIYIYISLHGATFYKTECIIILLVRAANMTWIEIVQDKI